MASLIQRGRFYYIQYCVSGKPRRRSLRTDSPQIARDKLRQFESAALRGADSPLPTRTPIATVVGDYVAHIRGFKTAKSAQTDVYYLREAFGAICPALQVTSRKLSPAARKRPLLPPKEGQDRRRRPVTIEAASFEQITTAQIAAFISGQVQSRGLAPKTANRYREILTRLFNWAMTQRGIHLPADRNPAAPVERYREHAPRIRYLTLPQVAEQLQALAPWPQLQTMAAVAIYGGLRREEIVWLTADDVDLTFAPHGVIYVRAKTVGAESWEPKTKINRAVPVSSQLRPYLERYHRRPSHGHWFFPSPDGKRWDADNFSADLRTRNQAAGLQWSCGEFRHTFGSQLAIRGESLYKISKLMGNSPEICRRHYAALSQESLVEAVEFPSAPAPGLRLVDAG